MYNISIAFVCFNTKDLIKKNINLIKKLNKYSKINIKFYICDNNEKKTYVYIKNNKLVIFNGVKKNFSNSYPETDHHGRALNKLLINAINNDFFIILDPDFFIIENNWIIKTINFCNSKKISIFGAPWFPTHLTKQKYFPCPHYILFKKNILNKNLDFTIKNKKKLGGISRKYKINKHYGMLINFLLGRDWIKIIPDTGYKIYQRFIYSKIKFASLTPIISKNDLNEIMGTGIISYFIKFFNYFKKNEQRLLPENGRFVYKKHFKDKFFHGFQNFTFNKNTIHAIHLRSAIYRGKKKLDQNYIKKVLKNL